MAAPQTRSLARRLADLEKQRLLAKQPTLGFSTIVDGAIPSVDEDDAVKMIVGKQFDGTQTAAVVSGPTPPTPTIPLAIAQAGSIRLYWDGTFEADEVAPMDFARVLAYAVPLDDYVEPEPLNQAIMVGQYTSATGGEITAALTPSVEYAFYLVCWTEAGTYGDASDVEFATVGAIVDPVTEPPAVSPEIEVTGMPSSLLVVSEPVAPSTLIEYHISTTSGFTPTAGDPTTLTGPATRATVWQIASLPGDGSPLAVDTTYYVRALAINSEGPAAAASTEKSGDLDLSVVQSFVTGQLIANQIITEGLKAGSVEVGQITIDPDGGITIPQPDGLEIRLPADGTAATFAAWAVLFGVIIKGNASLYGLTKLFGTFQLASGVAAPDVAPSLSNSWPYLQTQTSEFTPYRFGLCEATDSDEWLTTVALLGVGRFVRIDKVTGDIINTGPDFGMQSTGGVTRIGSDFYTLGQDPSRGWDWYVYKFDSTYAKVDEFPVDPATSYHDRPTIGTDGTNILTAYTYFGGAFDGDLVFELYDTSMDGVPDTYILNLPGASFGNRDLGGVHRGSVDLGSSHTFVASNLVAVYAYNSSNERATANDFFRAGGSSLPKGMWWDGTRFWSLDTDGRIWEYAAHTANTTVSALHTNYDGDATGGTHETDAGLASATMTWNKRSWLKIVTPPPPDDGNTDPLQTDKADMVGVYVSQAASTYRFHEYLDPGVRDLMIETWNSGGAVPPVTNGFIGLPGGTGVFESQSGETFLDGTGDAWIPGTTDWVAVSSFTSPYTGSGVEYRIDPVGRLELRGGVTRNGAASGATAFTLPAGFRPTATVQRPVVVAPAGTASGFIQITSAGAVSFSNAMGTVNVYRCDSEFSTR